MAKYRSAKKQVKTLPSGTASNLNANNANTTASEETSNKIDFVKDLYFIHFILHTLVVPLACFAHNIVFSLTPIARLTAAFMVIYGSTLLLSYIYLQICTPSTDLDSSNVWSKLLKAKRAWINRHCPVFILLSILYDNLLMKLFCSHGIRAVDAEYCDRNYSNCWAFAAVSILAVLPGFLLNMLIVIKHGILLPKEGQDIFVSNTESKRCSFCNGYNRETE